MKSSSELETIAVKIPQELPALYGPFVLVGRAPGIDKNNFLVMLKSELSTNTELLKKLKSDNLEIRKSTTPDLLSAYANSKVQHTQKFEEIIGPGSFIGDYVVLRKKTHGVHKGFWAVKFSTLPDVFQKFFLKRGDELKPDEAAVTRASQRISDSEKEINKIKKYKSLYKRSSKMFEQQQIRGVRERDKAIAELGLTDPKDIKAFKFCYPEKISNKKIEEYYDRYDKQCFLFKAPQKTRSKSGGSTSYILKRSDFVKQKSNPLFTENLASNIISCLGFPAQKVKPVKIGDAYVLKHTKIPKASLLGEVYDLTGPNAPRIGIPQGKYFTKGDGKSIGDIPYLGVSLAAYLMLGDFDTIGKDGQNKMLKDGEFTAIDTSKIQTLLGVINTNVNSDLTIRTTSITKITDKIRHWIPRNFACFYDTKLSERILGVHLLKRALLDININELVDDYKKPEKFSSERLRSAYVTFKKFSRSYPYSINLLNDTVSNLEEYERKIKNENNEYEILSLRRKILDLKYKKYYLLAKKELAQAIIDPTNTIESYKEQYPKYQHLFENPGSLIELFESQRKLHKGDKDALKEINKAFDVLQKNLNSIIKGKNHKSGAQEMLMLKAWEVDFIDNLNKLAKPDLKSVGFSEGDVKFKYVKKSSHFSSGFKLHKDAKEIRLELELLSSKEAKTVNYTYLHSYFQKCKTYIKSAPQLLGQKIRVSGKKIIFSIPIELWNSKFIPSVLNDELLKKFLMNIKIFSKALYFNEYYESIALLGVSEAIDIDDTSKESKGTESISISAGCQSFFLPFAMEEEEEEAKSEEMGISEESDEEEDAHNSETPSTSPSRS